MTGEELLAQAETRYNKRGLAKLTKAVDFATEKHLGQLRESGEEYITHPLSVASILIGWEMDIDTIIAGVLHDTVEDTGATIEELEKAFDKNIAFLVDGVTKVSQARAGMRDLDSYLPATKDNLAKLMIAVGKDIRVIIIKLADRLHNMQTLQFMSPEKQKKIARETIEVFAPLADRLNMGRVRVQLEEISFRFLMPKVFNDTKSLMDSRIKKSQRKLNKVKREVENKLNSEHLTFKMDGRVKSVYSLYKKLDRVGDIDKIYDLIALRIIVDDISTCYLALSVLHEMYQPQFERIKDYVAQPKKNGYQSLHTTVQTQSGQIVEFQIRTAEMHDYAERGLAASFHYNEQKLTDAYRKGRIAELPADLSWIQELQKTASRTGVNESFDSEKFRMELFNDRIFVYSPKGDIYDLPVGSYPLDYAYRIHSDLAARASGFMVNGAMKPFDYQLKHGDVIEVLTSKTAKPKVDWRELVTTSHAKDKLRNQLSKQGGIIHQLTGSVASLFSKK
ncbi:bifunctional (p)ppGpp synthetase/guanosine-3',5'-bis(diphosphate) 3'-pyrophosphohydrolase [Candidatus Saccharibacteria bacterium]|nr:bifunctional (p)ppGpp synthetase/guanosine-3',5'-bis(diphosphate) 3'-pyrophosphohydrolase [Candidatus Saccharibacteria bacterium]